MSSTAATLIIAAVVVLTLGATNIYITHRRGVAMINRWAIARGWKVRACHFDFFGRALSSGYRPVGERIFWAVIEQSSHLCIEGWIRCNFSHTGRYAGRVEPLWDLHRGFEIVPIKSDDNDQIK